MEEIKGMTRAEAEKWLMKHGYGLGHIEDILADWSEPAPKAAPAPAPAPKPTAAPAPKAAAKAAPKASK